MIVQFAGLLVTIYAFSSLQFYAVPVQPASSLPTAFGYIVYIIGTALVILLLIKVLHGDILFVLLEAIIVLFATSFLLFIILGTAFASVNYIYIAAISIIATLALIVAKNFRPKLRNLIAITSSIGVGVLIGLNGFYIAYLLTLFIAVYDYIAVFVTKHMITLARAVSERNLAFLIGSSDVEAMPKSYVTKKDRAEFAQNVDIKKIKDPVINYLIKTGGLPVISQVQLGTGDLAIPLMLTVSAYISFLSYSLPMMIILGSTFGMIFTMYLLKKYKVALPAIPPIFAFINLFLGIAFLATKPSNYSMWLDFFAVFVVTILILFSKLNQMAGTKAKD
ncbi:MAG: hypothetical protein KGH67_00670 [Candidatus Micrarchaeota archaeon]|nr:hypothetical protein [Candidatus Micrarchaeota archaeon]